MKLSHLISLTFDDGIDQHLDVAVPALDAVRMKGTFYAHLSATTFSTRMNEWICVAQNGHEIGNHTVFHPADIRKSWVREGNALDLYTLDRMDMELTFANQWLTAMDGQLERTFAYPCSNTILGAWGSIGRLLFQFGLRNTRWPGLVEKRGLDFGNTRNSYRHLTLKHFVAARGGGLHLSERSPEISQIRRDLLPSAAIEGHTFEEMQSFVMRSLERPSWAILQFHGVGGGHHMDCDLSDFNRFVDWLAKNHSEKVVTIVDGASRVFQSASQKV